MKKEKTKKNKKDKIVEKVKTKNFNLMLLVTFFLGVLLIFSAYAWFQSALNVQVKFVNLVVSKKNGLFISLDGINYGSSVEISRETLIDHLKTTYPNNTSQWAKNGLYPVSSNGISNSNTEKFDMFVASGYEVDPFNNKGYLSTRKSIEKNRSDKKDYLAFDLFLKNITGSPVSDNLYIDNGTNVILNSEKSEQIEGMINSVRFGFVKVGTVSRESTIEEIQNISCNNDCEMVIYEPNAVNHTELSIERAKKYGVNLLDGQYFPTYAIENEMNFYDMSQLFNGNISKDFDLQITRVDITRPIFELPDGITKIRVYVWLEGQDIDSLETRSEGADVSVIINLIKDTAGYDAFNE